MSALGGRELLQRPLDAAGNAVTGLPTSVASSDAVRRDEMLAGDATNAAAIAAETAARAAADALIPGTITALTGDVTASGTGAVAAALANLPQAVLLARLAALTADPAFNSRKLTLLADGVAATDAATVGQVAAAATLTVANNAALAAVDASKLGDGASRRVETYLDWFDLDKVKVRSAVADEIISASGGTGWWWVRRRDADPSWLTQAAWKIDSSAGSDENLGDPTHPLKTLSEFARRTWNQQLIQNLTATIAGGLNAGDTLLPRVKVPIQASFTGFYISLIGTPVQLATGTVSAYATRVGSTETVTAMNAGFSWATFVGKIVEWTDGTTTINARVVEDLGSNLAALSPPINRDTLIETPFINGTTRLLGSAVVTVYDETSIGASFTNDMSRVDLKYLRVTDRFHNFSGQSNLTNCSGDSICWSGQINRNNCLSGIVSGGSALWASSTGGVAGGFERFVVTLGASVRINSSCTVKSLRAEGNAWIHGISGGPQGTTDLEFNVPSTQHAFDPGGVYGGTFSFHGFVYGKSANPDGILVQFGGRGSIVSLGHVPAVTGATTINYALAATTNNISVIATRESNDVNGNCVIGPPGRTLNDNASQPIANLADPSNPQDAATKHYVDASFSGGVPLTDGDKGDVVVSGSGAVWTVDTDVVTFAKMQNIPTQTLVGRQTAGTGDPESIGVTGGIEFDGSGHIQRGALTGDVSASAGSAGTVINPNVVTNAQLAQVPTGTLKGRSAAGTGNTGDLTFAAVKAALAIVFADVTGTLQAAQFPALTGDVTTTAGSLATALSATGVAAGTYGDASHVAQVTVDAKGRVTAASSPSISITAGAVSGLSTTQTGALTGDVTKPAGSGATTLANIPDGTPMAGALLAATRALPATPAAGHLEVWASNTDEVLAAKGVGGSVTHTVKTHNQIAHEFLIELTDSGDVSSAQPSYDDLSGTPQPWATYQFTFVPAFNVPLGNGFLLRAGAGDFAADSGGAEVGYPFFGAGKPSTFQSLQATCFNWIVSGGGVFQWTFTLTVDGAHTSLVAIITISGSGAAAFTFGNLAALTIPDGSRIGVHATGAVVSGTVTHVFTDLGLTAILR